MKKRLLGLSLSLVLLMGCGEAVASVSMTLEQYMREILLNNHSLRAGVKSVEADYYSVLAAVGTQRPLLAATAGETVISHQGNDLTTLGLALTHRIDISGKYSLDERQRILGYEVSRAQFDANLNSLIATAEQAWWSAVLARENVRLQQEVLTQRSENHRVTMEKYRQELVPRLDIVRSEAQVVEAESQVKQAETSYQNLLANLSYLAGGLDVEPEEQELRVPKFNVDVNYDEALTFRPDVRSARLSVERAKLVKKLTGKGLSPTLDLSAQWTAWSDPEVTNSVPKKGEAMMNLSFKLPIFDGHQTKYSVMNADRMIQAAEAKLQSIEEETRRDIAVAMNDWKNAEAAEVDCKRQVERAQEELHITELMYSEGMGAQIDLINAQVSYRSVSTEYLAAVRDMYVALVSLRKAMGDYAPDEDGTWREAVARYGKGNNVLGEVGLKSLRDSRIQIEKRDTEEKSGTPASAKKPFDVTPPESDEEVAEIKAALQKIYQERGIK